MRLRVIAAVLLLGPVALASGVSFDLRRPTHDAPLLRSFALMVRDSFGLVASSEISGFVVESGSGELSVVRWETSAGMNEEHFRGTLPPGVVAVVHTHPGRRVRPSSGDIGEAMRTGLPFYVLTQGGIWVVDPSSGRSFEVAPAGWKQRAEQVSHPSE